MKKADPWLMWLSGLGIILQTERSPVQFQVRARAWVAGFLSRIDVSCPLFFPPFPSP